MNLNLNKVLDELKVGFEHLDADWYLYNQRIIETVFSVKPELKLSEHFKDVIEKFYLTREGDVSVFLNSLPLSKQEKTQVEDKLSVLRNTRYRAISTWIVEKNNDGNHVVYRAEEDSFSQPQAISSREFDFRLYPREFMKLSENADNASLKAVFSAASDKVFQIESTAKRLKLICHHTKIITDKDNLGSNSPEGIHQDGMDYIVSAFVVERNNISGGESVIFGADAKTPLFKIALQPGQGVFQPDVGTDLWHVVTPFHLKNIDEQGVRASIGFDFEIME